MRFRNNKGFTLIELLIVLAILGILVGIVAMSVSGLVGTARTTGMDSEHEILLTAIDTYNTQDVAVDPANNPELTAQASWAQCTPSTSGFGQYLKRTTKYFYQWEASGANVTQDEDGV
jgi:general secretion pathway protein G